MVPAYLSWNASIRRSAETLPNLGQAPFFQGQDQHGNRLSSADVGAEDWIFCFLNPGEAGQALANSFAEIDRDLGRANQIVLLSMLTQPSLSPEQLALYASRNEASNRWRFISTSPEDLDRAKAAWRQLVDRAGLADSKTQWFALVDRSGHLRKVYDARSEEAVQWLLTDLGSLLRSEKK